MRGRLSYEIQAEKTYNKHTTTRNNHNIFDSSYILQYTILGAIIFAVVSVALLGANRYIENKHLKEEE